MVKVLFPIFKTINGFLNFFPVSSEAWLKLLPGMWEFNKGLPDIIKAYDDLDIDDLNDGKMT